MGCDSFCQQAKILDDQSFGQFEQEIRSFEAQFGGAGVQNVGLVPSAASPAQPAQPAPTRQPGGSVFTPSSITTRQPRPQAATTRLPRPAPTPRPTPATLPPTPATPQPTSRSNPRPTTPRAPRSRAPSTPRPTRRPTRRPAPSSTTQIEQVKGRGGFDSKTTVSIPIETTTRKNTKIKWTFNGVRFLCSISKSYFTD